MLNILEELDLKNWKLPVEPQQLVMLYLAYKLINKLDNQSFTPLVKPVVKPDNNSGGVFIIVFFVFVAYLLCSSLIDRINVSSVFIDDIRPINTTKVNKKCPMKNLSSCPLSRYPLFGSTKTMEENLMKMCPEFNPNVKECPMFKKCPVFNKNNCPDICNDKCEKECPKECKKDERPPFPSVLTYDAKAWSVMKEYAKPNALFWNVGK